MILCQKFAISLPRSASLSNCRRFSTLIGSSLRYETLSVPIEIVVLFQLLCWTKEATIFNFILCYPHNQAECTVGNMSFENRMWMKLSLPLMFFAVLAFIFFIFLLYMLTTKFMCPTRHFEPLSYIKQMFRRSFNAYFTLLGIAYLTLADTLVSFFECKVGRYFHQMDYRFQYL